MVKLPARDLLRTPVLDIQGRRIARLKDIIIDTRTGSMIYLIVDQVDSSATPEISQQLPTGETVVPISVAEFRENSATVDVRKLKLLSLKKSLKERTIQARDSETKPIS